MIRENNKLEEFQYFLKQNGLDYQLGFEKENDGYILYAYYRNGERTEKATFLSSGINWNAGIAPLLCLERRSFS